MTAIGWAAWLVVLIAFVVVAWGIWVDAGAREEVRAQLDELAGDYHSPAARIAALETTVAALLAHATDDQPSTGRHAHTGQVAA